MSKFYELPKYSLVKLSEEDGRIFHFYEVNKGEAMCKYNNSYLYFKATDDVIAIGRFSDYSAYSEAA